MGRTEGHKTMTETLPTFASNRDRVTFLVAEYRIPITAMLIAGGLWAAYFRPEVPTPPQYALDFSLAWGILALPSFIAGKMIVKWLYHPDWVIVGIADPGENEIYDVKKVPPELWNDKSIVNASPLQPDGGVIDAIVTKFEFYEDIGELEIRGCERADMTPADALTNAARVDEYYEHMHEYRRAYSRLKASVLDKCSEIHDLTIMTWMAEREQAEMVPGASVTSLIEEVEELAEEVPDDPEPEETDHSPWGDLEPPNELSKEQLLEAMNNGDRDPIEAKP